MKILLDCRFKRGAGPNITSNYLLAELLRLNEGDEFVLLQHTGQTLTADETVDRIYVPAATDWQEFIWIQSSLNRRMRRESVDLYHSLKHFGPLFADVPVILPVRAVSQFLDGKQELSLVDRVYWRNVGAAAWKRADLILAVSKVCRDVLTEKLGIDPAKIEILHHGVHDRFRPLPPEERAREPLDRFGVSGDFVLCVGNPYSHKNYETAVRALYHLHRSLPSASALKLAIIGDERYVTPSLRSVIAELGLSEHVVFTGFVTHDDLVYFYNAASLLLFTSYYEAFPNPIIESMACGLPVIAADRGAVPEIAARGAILIEDPEDHRAFARAAAQLLTDDGCRTSLRKAALQRARDFRWDVTARRVLGYYDQFRGQQAVAT